MSKIEFENLKIFHDEEKLVDISFEISDSLALVGESGSGKSITLKAILDLLPSNLKSDKHIKSSFEFIRGKTVTLVPQNPFTSFSPLTKIIDHFDTSFQKASKLMSMVDLDSKLLDRFPPELSGGQLQRVAISLALLPSPKLILFDEPTTALDSTSKQSILDLISSMQKKLDFKMLFVSHDILSVQKICKKIIVLKKGEIVEKGEMEKVLLNPIHPYTKQLIESGFKNRQKRE